MEMNNFYGKIIERVNPNIYAIDHKNGIMLVSNKFIYSMGKIDNHESPIFEQHEQVYVMIKKDTAKYDREIDYKGNKWTLHKNCVNNEISLA